LFEASERADETVRQVARENEVILIDASASHLSGDVDYFTDQVHLTREGSAEFARYVAAELQQILE
jgi:lysophospholipase L1-like esterase